VSFRPLLPRLCPHKDCQDQFLPACYQIHESPNNLSDPFSVQSTYLQPTYSFVLHAAHGGQIILSESTFEALRSINSDQATGCAGSKCVLLHMGRHIVPGHPSNAALMPPSKEGKAKSSGGIWLKNVKQVQQGSKALRSGAEVLGGIKEDQEGEPTASESGVGEDVTVDLYQLIHLKQLCRLSLFPSRPVLRTERQLTPSVPDSPIGCVAVAALQVVGLAILRSELSEATFAKALAIFDNVSIYVHSDKYLAAVDSLPGSVNAGGPRSYN